MRYILITLILCLASIPAAAAEQRQWYNPPAGSASSISDAAKMQIYTPGVGSQTVTGSTLRTTPSDTPISSRPISSSNPYQRVYEGRTSDGVITTYITANGIMVLGTPLALAVSSVYPANGATGVATSAVPSVTFNKAVWVDISTAYIQGNSTAPVGDPTNPGQTMQTWTIPATLAAGTTYTIKVVKGSIPQTDGETTSSCGTAMTEVSGVCQSTFTTAP